MKSVKFKTLAAVALFSLAVASCNKKDDPDPVDENKPAEMGFTFKHVVGIDPLVLGTNNQYFNDLNEQFQVTTFKYYVSNVKLIKKDGTSYAEPESYHLLNEATAASKHFHLEDIPYGEYTGIEFLVGVDEARNTTGAQTGALDPANDMFWSWTTGYIMAKLEGLSSSSTQTDNKFRYHIGGFTGDNNGIRTIKLNFASNMVISSGAVGEVEMKADVKKWFGSNLSIASTSDVMMVGPTSRKIADNYAQMFSITSSSVVIE
jgi:hypothetical protein